MPRQSYIKNMIQGPLRDPQGPPGTPRGPPGDPPGTPQGPPGPPRGSPELLETSKGHPRNPPGPLLAPQLSGQSVPGQLSGYVVGFCDPPTSLGVGLGGVTCSGFGSAASAEGLSILCTYSDHLLLIFIVLLLKPWTPPPPLPPGISVRCAQTQYFVCRM